MVSRNDLLEVGYFEETMGVKVYIYLSILSFSGGGGGGSGMERECVSVRAETRIVRRGGGEIKDKGDSSYA